ncbi:MAG: aldo/keto reductase [Solirubrobacterales bacterium]|nr:aldo/keto reductase [Solirubrobacterales bacterium]
MTTTHKPLLAGRPVNRIGFGAMQLEKAPHAVGLLREARDAGVDHIDTAQFYDGVNTLIRDALAPYPDNLVLATKVGAERDAAGQLIPAQRPEQLRAQVEANLNELGADSVAVVNLRRLDTPPGIIAESDQLVDLDSQLVELSALRDAGKVAAIGLSNVSETQLQQALPAGIACVQNSYSVLDRSAEPVLDLCAKHGIAWVPFFPLGSAFERLPSVADDPTVRAIASELGATPSQVGLAWLLQHYENTLLIPGTSNPVHLKENLAAGELRLGAGAIERLKARSAA